MSSPGPRNPNRPRAYAVATFGSATIFAYLTHWLFLPHSEQKALRWIDFTANNFARRSSQYMALGWL